MTVMTDMTRIPTFQDYDRKQSLLNREEKLVFGEVGTSFFPR